MECAGPAICKAAHDDDVRLLLTMAFDSQADFELVGCVADGRAALDAWRQLRPELFVVDYRMPEMDGLGVVRHVLDEDPNQVIVMFSANPTVQEPALAAGVSAFVLKGEMMTLPQTCRNLLATATATNISVVCQARRSSPTSYTRQREPRQRPSASRASPALICPENLPARAMNGSGDAPKQWLCATSA